MKEIKYKINTSTDITPVRDLEEKNAIEIYEYDLYWQSIYIDILGSKKSELDDFENINLGYISGTYFKINDMEDDGVDKIDVFDSISQETYEVYKSLYDVDGIERGEYIGINGNVFYIDRFYIEKEYKNLGIGSKALIDLEIILKYSLNCKVGNFILLPSAIEKIDNSLQMVKDNEAHLKLTNKLKKFYKHFGFKKIKNSNYMYFNTDYKMKDTE
jgi:GNAT superfamily N-acetyltransferase